MDGSAPAVADDTRVPPHDMDAEAAVLSALFIAPTTTIDLEPEHFYSDANTWLYRAIRATEPADAITVAHWLRAQGRFHQVGGAAYLGQIIDRTPSVANVQAHAAIVRELYRRRVLIAAFQVCEAELYAGELAAADAWRRMKEACET